MSDAAHYMCLSNLIANDESWMQCQRLSTNLIYFAISRAIARASVNVNALVCDGVCM